MSPIPWDSDVKESFRNSPRDHNISATTMPTTVEPSIQNRRPRRSSSITRHLQRMLHLDKQTGQRQDDRFQDSSDSNATSSSNQMQRPSSQSLNSYEYLNYKTSEINSNAHSAHSQSSLNSKLTGLTSVKNPESLHSSLQSLQDSHHQPPLISSVDQQPDRPEIRLSQTWNHNSVERKDRRATRRLEAERLQLEKRLNKLEQAERTGDVNVLKRESRRLTKKQPLGSSSRSSSASGDESRPSSRLSSIFSSSRRRSRSRSSSVEAKDNLQRTRNEDTPAYSTADTGSAAPGLSMTMPERLGVAISKELAIKSNALLPDDEKLIESQPASQPDMTKGAYQDDKQLSHGEAKTSFPLRPEPSPIDRLSKDDCSRLNSPGINDSFNSQTDLDRESFAATLRVGKRGSRLSNTVHSNKTNGEENKRQSDSTVIFKSHATEEVGCIDKFHSPSATPSNGLPRSTLNRSFVDGIPLKNPRRFKSSPLAESITANINTDSPSKTETVTTFPNTQTSDSTHDQSKSINRARTFQGASSQPPSSDINPLTRASTSNSSQAGPPRRLTKPRFYTFIGSASGPSNSLNHEKNASMDSQSPLGQSPISTHQESVDRNKQDKPQHTTSRTRHMVTGQKPRHTRGASSTTQSQGSDSEEYNTADELASNASESGDVIVRSRKGPDGNPGAIPQKNLLVNALDLNLKKPTGDTKQPGGDQSVVKLFVICCHCKFWHDMPSAVYARLAYSNPSSVVPERDPSNTQKRNSISTKTATRSSIPTKANSSLNPSPTESSQSKSFPSQTTPHLPHSPVQCCWCQHNMGKQCCQGWTTVVQMRRRHH